MGRETAFVKEGIWRGQDMPDYGEKARAEPEGVWVVAGNMDWAGLEKLLFLGDRIIRILSMKVMLADVCLECRSGVRVDKFLSQKRLDPGVQEEAIRTGWWTDDKASGTQRVWKARGGVKRYLENRVDKS